MEFILTQKAKKAGGDKYTCTSDPTFTIYVPQAISRVKDIPHLKLQVDITPAFVKTPVVSQIEDVEDSEDEKA